jgi:general secretion pathway protein I
MTTARQCTDGSDRRRGFTLVEVLASLVLVAIILPVAMKGISVASELATLARQRTEAGALAEATLAEIIATGEWQEGDLSGDFGDEHPGYSWSAEVENWEGTYLKQITLQVRWTERGKERTVTLTTLAYTGDQ